MATTSSQVTSTVRHLSEIFPIRFSNDNYQCFRLSPNVNREVGNRFSWRFSQKSKNFENIVVIWSDEIRAFCVLAKPGVKIPSLDEWRTQLEHIQEQLEEELGDRYYTIQWIREPQITTLIQAQLAIQLLNMFCNFPSDTVFSKNKVEVKREVDFWTEIIDFKAVSIPAITLTVHSSFIYKEDLEQFFNNHPYRNDPEKLLVGLQVRECEKNKSATIVGIVGQMDEQKKEYLLKKATGAISKQKIIDAPNNQPVVSVKFSKGSKEYYYALAALRPCVTQQTADLFDVQYGELLKQTKIQYEERKKLLILYKNKAKETLSAYGIELLNNINSKDYALLFFTPKVKLEDTPLLFGNQVIKKNNQTIIGNPVVQKRNQTLRGLSQGGVYKRHDKFQDPAQKIRLAIIKPSDWNIDQFCQLLQERLENYKFPSLLPPENKYNFDWQGLSKQGVDLRANIEEIIDELIANSPDIVLVFLPQVDRNTDDTEDGSLYSWIYSRFLSRGIATQFIYEDTLKKTNSYKYVLYQVVPGILGKLGNLPFVLANPLNIADYVIGLDISRSPKKKLPGSRNACASVRLYGKRGEFMRYRIEDALVEGEEIPQRSLENFLPRKELQNKIVLIYRDGRFQGKEVEHLLARAKAINAKLILVECYKSHIPRLYSYEKQKLKEPTRGLALCLSSREVILVTTQVVESIGVPRPLRLKVREEGEQVSLTDLVDATLKLTLLHYGSLNDPRLPIPVYSTDAIARLRLRGIFPGLLEDDCQPWL